MVANAGSVNIAQTSLTCNATSSAIRRSPNPELNAIHYGLLAFSTDVVFNTGIHKSLLDVLRLGMVAVSLAITVPSVAQDSDT